MGKIIPDGVEFVCCNAENIPLPDESFDFILIRSVLEYTNIELVLKEVKRLLKEEGYFVLAQKVMDGYSSDVNLILELENLRNPLKRNLGFMSNISREVAKTELKILNSRTYTQNYFIDFNKWLSRNNTITLDNQIKLKHIITSLTEEVTERTGLKLINNILHSKLTWAIITCHKNSFVNPKTNVVISMIVEKTVGSKKFILLQKRKYLFTEPHYYNVWELPQGKLEANETIMEAAKRELFEETNLDLEKNLTIRKSTEYDSTQLERIDILTAVFTKGSLNYLGLCLLVQAKGIPKPYIQDTEPQWIEIKDLKRILKDEKIFPLNIPMLEKYIELNNLQ
jgi:8-oxo-dGTP pyrophosphatase MutT (NUDIX family)